MHDGLLPPSPVLVRRAPRRVPRPCQGDLWDLLYFYGADVVVNGHEHQYERFAPQDPNGIEDAARGLRQFVVGTGGRGLDGFGATEANSEVRDSDTHGVIKFTLRQGSYEWEFVPVAGKTFTDSGSDDCH